MAEARSYFRIVSSNGSVSNFLELDERSVPNRLRLTGRSTNDECQVWYWARWSPMGFNLEEDVLRNKKSGGFLSGSGYSGGSMLVRDRRIAPKDEDRWQFQGGELKRKDRRYLALDAATCNLKPRNGTRSQRWVLHPCQGVQNVQPIRVRDRPGNPVEIPARNHEIPRNPVSVPSIRELSTNINQLQDGQQALGGQIETLQDQIQQILSVVSHLKARQTAPGVATLNQSTDGPECIICFEGPQNCVLVSNDQTDCGHASFCVPCGRKLDRCPICRAFIVRAVQIRR